MTKLIDGYLKQPEKILTDVYIAIHTCTDDTAKKFLEIRTNTMIPYVSIGTLKWSDWDMKAKTIKFTSVQNEAEKQSIVHLSNYTNKLLSELMPIARNSRYIFSDQLLPDKPIDLNELFQKRIGAKEIEVWAGLLHIQDFAKKLLTKNGFNTPDIDDYINHNHELISDSKRRELIARWGEFIEAANELAIIEIANSRVAI